MGSTRADLASWKRSPLDWCMGQALEIAVAVSAPKAGWLSHFSHGCPIVNQGSSMLSLCLSFSLQAFLRIYLLGLVTLRARSSHNCICKGRFESHCASLENLIFPLLNFGFRLNFFSFFFFISVWSNRKASIMQNLAYFYQGFRDKVLWRGR